MTCCITEIQELFTSKLNVSITNIEQDLECKEYSGYNFRSNNFKIKFRKAKVTSKKIGQFVTLWKRNVVGETIPFDINDDFDFYIIYTQQDFNKGMFIFSKRVLAEKQILSGIKEGKRGFRVYPNWDRPLNNQALKTQSWQEKYFVSVNDHSAEIINKYKSITSENT